MPTIAHLSALEILDSRGRPTVRATCELAGGAIGTVSVPSGASTGRAEAVELRDGDPARYGGLGCRRAVGHVAGPIHAALAGKSFADQAALDGALVILDGTPDKSRLGANALLAVSLAFARAVAAERGVPLYRSLANDAGREPEALPRPTINLFSGGKHAGGQMPIQDVLIVPTAPTVDECLATAYAVYQAAAAGTAERYGARALVADEGGLAPPFPDAAAMLDEAVAAIDAAGFAPGRDAVLAVDVAASHFSVDGRYALDPAGGSLTGEEMVETLLGWLDRYPIASIEDGLAEDDWATWPTLRRRAEGRALILGDDLLATNPARIRRAVEIGAADALLLKPNQIGTLTEAAVARALAVAAGWRTVVSARSGETEDDWLADLAVGWGGDGLKVGSITRSERLAKWNRLLAIEAETGWPVVGWPEPR
ncbi:MAG: Enolase [uncultured Thermomicrobiales bacterium]|uniref:Enolase n=1 Tax=uncultured Thermomicrobiales bacterium TaxID=1645740 RepID=A0A6J4UGP3_9BACT|nr:MAG: Enolase [uncultured Thermomicrobiales bacterium]